MELTIDNIVNALKINRADFDNFFQQVQVGLPERLRRSLDGLSQDADDNKAFAVALAYAQAQHFLTMFLECIVQQSLEKDGAIGLALKEAALNKNNNPSLQAMTNVVKGFDYPEIRKRGMDEGIQWTAKVLIDNAPAGTAVLIGAHLLLTAWHVVYPLFEPVAGLAPQGPGVLFRNQTWVPQAGSHSRLKVRFDELTFENKTPFDVEAAENWLVWACACHDDEIPALPADKTVLNGYWDYAIIALNQAPGLQRKWANLDPRAVVPKAKDTVFVFQHPNGSTLQLDDDELGGIDPPVVPQYRFLHYANTAKGSSGGPCFDRSFLLFGLHQGEWYAEQNKADGEKQYVNRGIPIKRIIEHMNAHGVKLPAPPPSMIRIWTTLASNGKRVPAVGTDSFQTLIWNSALTGDPRLITIDGKKQSGKSFMLDMLAPMLPEGGHLKLIFEVESYAKKEVIPVATMICKAAGAAIPVFPAPKASTDNNWLRDDVAGAVVIALEKVRDSRMVWLCFKNLNLSKVENDQTRLFLLALCESLVTNTWLRIILDGNQEEIPYSVTDIYREFMVPDVSIEDINNFLNWAVRDLELQDLYPPAAVHAFAIGLKRNYEKANVARPAEAKKELVIAISKQVSDFIEASNQ